MNDSYRPLRWIGLAIAVALPTLITWVYFVLANQSSTGIQQTVYLIVKIVQFAFPAAWTWFILREPIRTAHPTAAGIALGFVFGVIVVAAGMALFEFMFRSTAAFDSAAVLIHRKVGAFGIDTVGKYFVLAGFYSLFHSLFEEYYWRWFVFRQLQRLIPLWPAIVLSGLSFTLHHIVVLSVFFPGAIGLIVAFAAATTVGGSFWAWLYQRSDSLFDTWLSHLVIDAGLFFGVGYVMLRCGLAAG